MATRLNKRQADNTRSAIKTGLLLKRLQEHALSNSKKTQMTATQVRAAEIALRKSLPDLSAIEMTGELQTGPVVTHEQLLAKLGIKPEAKASAAVPADGQQVPAGKTEG